MTAADDSTKFDAVQHLTTALRIFKERAVLVEEIRCRWGIARIAQKGGNPETAVSRLQSVREEFARIGSITDAALVTLDLMETYLMLRKWSDVRLAAGNVVTLFRDAGMLTGALTAANWLRHATRMKTVTPSISTTSGATSSASSCSRISRSCHPPDYKIRRLSPTPTTSRAALF